MFARGADHQHRHARTRLLCVEWTEHRERVGDLGPAPAGAGLGHLKIAARCGTPSLHLDPGVGNIEQFTGLMFAENTGDVVIHHHDLIDFAVPLLGEHADRRRAASHPHPLLSHAVNDRRISSLHDDVGAAVDRQIDRFTVAQIHQRVTGDAALLL